MMRRAMLVLGCLAVTLWVAGCRVNVEKGANGDRKKVSVDTPFGGIQVNTGQTTAADVGLPAYPGAQLVTGDENHKSADVRMGFGEWQMRVQVASYSTADSDDKVEAFYRKALSSFGDVIACRDGAPVGAEAKTALGLTCSEDGYRHTAVDSHGRNDGYRPERDALELKAGSEQHQHIVAVQSPQSGRTRFALVALDLPNVGNGNAGKSD